MLIACQKVLHPSSKIRYSPALYKACCVFFLILIGTLNPAPAQPLCENIFARSAIVKEKPLQNKHKAHKAQVKPIFDAKEALVSKILAIRNAKKTIDLTYYIFKRDQTGYLILNELVQALKRQVNIRIMVDSIGSNHPTHTELLALIQLSKSPGMGQVQVVTINPPRWIPRMLERAFHILSGRWREEKAEGFISVNNRSHDKILLIDAGTDNALAIIGSRNIGDSYAGLNKDKKEAYRDVDLMIKPENQESGLDLSVLIQEYYERIFYHNLNKILGERLYRIFPLQLYEQTVEMNQAQRQFEQDASFQEMIKAMQDKKYLETDFQDSEVRLVHELQNLLMDKALFMERWFSWTKKANPNSLMRTLKEEILRAKEKVTIISPYIILSHRDLRLIKKWLIENPRAEFELMSNSTRTRDSILAQAIFDQFVATKLQEMKSDPRIGDRLKIYSYHGNDVAQPELKGNLLHAKVAIIDGVKVLIGTSNFDPRSRRFNTEIGIWLSNTQAVEKLAVYYEDLVAHSYQWGTPEWQDHRRHYFGMPLEALQYYLMKLLEKSKIAQQL